MVKNSDLINKKTLKMDNGEGSSVKRKMENVNQAISISTTDVETPLTSECSDNHQLNEQYYFKWKWNCILKTSQTQEIGKFIGYINDYNLSFKLPNSLIVSEFKDLKSLNRQNLNNQVIFIQITI